MLLPIFVDQLNGFLVYELSFTLSISQIFKSFYLLAFLGIIILYDSKGEKRVFSLFYILLLFLPIVIVNSYTLSKYSDMHGDIAFFSKLLMLPLTYFTFSITLEKRSDFHNLYTNKLIVILFMTVFIAMLFSLAGYGRSNYGIAEGGITYGFRGYFIAGNEIGALYIMLYSLFLYYAMYVKRTSLFIIFSIVCGGITALLMVTKTVLLAFILITFGLPIMLTIYERGNLLFSPSAYMRKLYMSTVVLFTLSITVGSILFLERIMANMDRMTFNLNRAGNIVSFLLSGRDKRAGPVLDFYYNHYSPIEILFGSGWNHFQYAIEKNGDQLTAEMDLIDLLLSNGLIGVMTIYGFWIYMVIKIFKIMVKRETALSVPLFIASMLLFINSFFSGHILYSAMLTFYLGFFFALLNAKVNTNYFKYKAGELCQ